MNIYIFLKDEKNNTKQCNFHMDSLNNIANLEDNNNNIFIQIKT